MLAFGAWELGLLQNTTAFDSEFGNISARLRRKEGAKDAWRHRSRQSVMNGRVDGSTVALGEDWAMTTAAPRGAQKIRAPSMR